MKIFVDADACPVVHIVEKLAKKYEIPCKLLCDTNHVLRSDYSDRTLCYWIRSCTGQCACAKKR